jgi:hypothetical protein
MNRTKLKTYAPKARRDFIAAVTARAAKHGITKTGTKPVSVQGDVALIDGQPFPKKVSIQRARLEERIKLQGFDQVVEEAAYTWFNRFAAIRFMEVQGYFDHGYRVLSHPDGKPTPEIVEHADHLDLPGLNRDRVIDLKLDGTKDEELYRMLLVSQCNALHNAMPFLFERIDDETELLLPDNLLHSDSLVRQMINEIHETDWQQIEIIGWLYQFYISERKDAVIGKVLRTEDIPAATQLFTPKWIVKYMVQNSLGARWLLSNPRSSIRAKMEYYVEPAEQINDSSLKLQNTTPGELSVEDLTLLDPACGSGHILVEAYDLLREIYLERGYTLREAPKLILERNLFGLDIDKRAVQLAGFALLMKAREDDRRILEKAPLLNILAFRSSPEMSALPGSNGSRNGEHDSVRENPDLTASHDRKNLIELFWNIEDIGSLTIIPEAVRETLCTVSQTGEHSEHSDLVEGAFRDPALSSIPCLVRQAQLLSTRYSVVVTNPPYIGKRGMNKTIKSYVEKHFPLSKADTYSSFFERARLLCERGGFISFITMQGWMFLSSFEDFRKRLISHNVITNGLHLGSRAFDEISGEVVQTVAFTVRTVADDDYVPVFVNLKAGTAQEKARTFLSGQNRYSSLAMKAFGDIPGTPIAYWLSEPLRQCFKAGTYLGQVATVRQGMATNDNAQFLRFWWEVSAHKCKFDAKNRQEAAESGKRWFPYNKGGPFRKWYGNNEYVVDWEDDGARIKRRKEVDLAAGKITANNAKCWNQEHYFKACATWSAISTGAISLRLCEPGFIFDTKGQCIFTEEVDDLPFYAAALNSVVGEHLLEVLAPTMDFNCGAVAKFPVTRGRQFYDEIVSNARKLQSLYKNDWDAQETSWDFEGSPLLSLPESTPLLSAALSSLSNLWEANFSDAMELEGANNQRLIDAYGLRDDHSIRVLPSTVSLARVDTDREVKNLISYVIGCIMGRYSLAEPSLIYAHAGGQVFDPARYGDYPADADGIIPITEVEWFTDDAVNRFVEFVKLVWSPATLRENLEFIAERVGRKTGESALDAIRRYLSRDFFKWHLRTYRKRPIYWLFSSGREKAFEALVYLHRYNEGTLSRMRMEYVTPLQGRIAARMEQLDRDIRATSSTATQTKLRKELEVLKRKQAELVNFDEELRHYADMRISLNLDDGVKVNYGKFGNLLAEVKTVTGGSDE